jgi:RHS repeat-associated protein
VGTPQQRTISTEWHASLPVPLKVTEKDASGTPLRETSYSYDANGNALTKTLTDLAASPTVSRTWTYTYNTFGQMLTETSPAGETTTYKYNTTNGNLSTITNALGQVTTYGTYNADGQPSVILAPNGQKTNLVYDEAGRVKQQRVTIYNPTMDNPNSTDADGKKWLSWPQWIVDLINSWCQLMGWDSPFTADNKTATTTVYTSLTYPASVVMTTSYEYDPAGQLIKVTLPNTEVLTYQYDDAHRLIGSTDQYGNSTSYTLDAAGNITSTEVKDNSGQLQQKNQQVYNNLGQLQQQLGNASQYQTNHYDNFDNLTSSTDNLGRNNSSSYDALNRKVTDTDPLNQNTQYEYNALDQLKKVIDPRNSTTTYDYNAFGETTQQSSPDTGTTSYQYSNGRLSQTTDARGITHAYSYDLLGRLTQRSDGTNTTSYSYDQGNYGKGLLSTISNSNTDIRYTRDSSGRVLEKIIATQGTKLPLRVRYLYLPGGQLRYMVLPSGRAVTYNYTKSRLTSITSTSTLLTNAVYGSYGAQGWTWGTNQGTVNYQYDLDGRVTAVNSGTILNRQYQYDGGNRITSINDGAASINQSYSHDVLDRLTQQILANQTLDYSYDANSNRTQLKKTVGSTITTSDYAIAATSNRIGTITSASNSKTYDYLPTGQITNDGERTFEYDSEGRSYRIQKGSAGIVNLYDPYGQRISKNSGSSSILFVYDETGQLIGEYSPSGAMIREYIWLEGRLVGMLSSQYPNQLLRVHTDHLGTVRAVSQPNTANTVVWRWEGDQFGDVMPTGNLIMPLRHPGQYYDAEVGTFYNYFRDYDPATGRYLQSDPIGLGGGLNTYGYVYGSPLKYSDPTGQFAFLLPAAEAAAMAICEGGGCAAAASATINSAGAVWIMMSGASPKSITSAKTVAEFCSQCKATDTRSQAEIKAYAWAGMSPGEGNPRPWDGFNPPGGSSFKKGPVWANFRRQNYNSPFGASSPTGTVEEHPFGHPDIPGGLNHECPHFVAKNAAGISMEFPYKPGT